MTYNIGDIGPAGGYLFYDKKNQGGGWRYLEAAPADLRVINGIPSVDAKAPGYADAPATYVFGYYRKNAFAPNLFVNGTTSFRETDCTSKDLKEGFFNTKALVSAMGDEAFASLSGPRKTGFYAARLCSVLEHTVDGVTFGGWFLPSMNELKRMYENIFKAGIGDFANAIYWSSSECAKDASICLFNDFGREEGEKQNTCNMIRSSTFRIRPVRMV